MDVCARETDRRKLCARKIERQRERVRLAHGKYSTRLSDRADAIKKENNLHKYKICSEELEHSNKIKANTPQRATTAPAKLYICTYMCIQINTIYARTNGANL